MLRRVLAMVLTLALLVITPVMSQVSASAAPVNPGPGPTLSNPTYPETCNNYTGTYVVTLTVHAPAPIDLGSSARIDIEHYVWPDPSFTVISGPTLTDSSQQNFQFVLGFSSETGDLVDDTIADSDDIWINKAVWFYADADTLESYPTYSLAVSMGPYKACHQYNHVTPQAPLATKPSCGDSSETVEPPAMTGVQWSTSESTKLVPGTSVTYTASPVVTNSREDKLRLAPTPWWYYSYAFPQGAQTSWTFTNTFDPSTCPVLNPQGSVTVSCEGTVTAMLDNSQSTESADYDIKIGDAFYYVTVPAGSTQKVTEHGQPGNDVSVDVALGSQAGATLDSAVIPPTCVVYNPKANIFVAGHDMQVTAFNIRSTRSVQFTVLVRQHGKTLWTKSMFVSAGDAKQLVKHHLPSGAHITVQARGKLLASASVGK